MIRKLFLLLIGFIIAGFAIAFCANNTTAQVLKGGVSAVPQSFFGTWRVQSKLVDTNSPLIFKENNVDLWNLSRLGDVITLSNPFNGAKADITIDSVSEETVIFTKSGKYGNKNLTDVVEIKLSGENFAGTDTIKLDTYSDVNGKIMKTETAKYSIKGEKIAGSYDLK